MPHFSSTNLELALSLPSHVKDEYAVRLKNSALQEKHLDPRWRYDGHIIGNQDYLEVAFAKKPHRRTTWPSDYWFKPIHPLQDPLTISSAIHADLARLAERHNIVANEIHSFMRFPLVRAVIRTFLIELERPEAQYGPQPDDEDIVGRLEGILLSTTLSDRQALLTQTTAVGPDFADRALLLCLIKLYAHFESWNRWKFGSIEYRPMLQILVAVVGLFCNAWVHAPVIDITWGHLGKSLSPPSLYSHVIDHSEPLPSTILTPEIWMEWSLMYDPWIRQADSVQLTTPEDARLSSKLTLAPQVFVAEVSEPEADKEGRVTVKYLSKPDEERWSFKSILDSRWAGKKPKTGLQYLVEWEYAEPSWQPARDLQGCEPWVLQFHRSSPKKPGPLPKLKRFL
ncbi:hypothetical protein CGCA056_v012345 [Colletotrichum aenigma]|uniref:uncharacterized protein n=1 Tax=Colletotrichum aenigma TaxID=1215731 RepID=UPI0018732BAF|nr:uncharacterized protein CGCA056_v012345 [Colletotrichum aenigma]KAF5512406.1 hypothetical protein CGCA056_v012345 [Colletotrichum aenigma]